MPDNLLLATSSAVVDQAKAVGVKLFIWSALESLSDHTNGKYPVPFFDTKAVITDYVKSSGLPYKTVQSGFYFSNFIVSLLQLWFQAVVLIPINIIAIPLSPPIMTPWQSGFCAPKKQADGTYLILLPVSPDLELAVLDSPTDFGPYVQAAIENPSLGVGSEVLTGSLTSVKDMAAELGRGKNFVFIFALLLWLALLCRHP